MALFAPCMQDHPYNKSKLKVLRCAPLLAHAASVCIFSPPPDGLKIPRSHGNEGQRGENVRGCLLTIGDGAVVFSINCCFTMYF